MSTNFKILHYKIYNFTFHHQFYLSENSNKYYMAEGVVESGEKSPPVCVLLPWCWKAKTDVFLNILKNIIARSKLISSAFDNALMVGMTSNSLAIESNDLSADWGTRRSSSEQIRQWKMLGFWAIDNFPSFCKRLHGEKWQAPKRIGAIINGNAMKVEDFDAIISKKMKLRIMVLDVRQSTIDEKLKFFVQVPNQMLATIDKRNECKISPKIKAYEIDCRDCWQAIKCGFFTDKVRFPRFRPIRVLIFCWG